MLKPPAWEFEGEHIHDRDRLNTCKLVALQASVLCFVRHAIDGSSVPEIINLFLPEHWNLDTY